MRGRRREGSVGGERKEREGGKIEAHGAGRALPFAEQLVQLLHGGDVDVLIEVEGSGDQKVQQDSSSGCKSSWIRELKDDVEDIPWQGTSSTSGESLNKRTNRSRSEAGTTIEEPGRRELTVVRIG